MNNRDVKVVLLGDSGNNGYIQGLAKAVLFIGSL
jgi:hypothetical protein